MYIKKAKIISIISIIVFLFFLIIATRVLLKKYEYKGEINLVDTPLETVFLLPNKGSIEIKIEETNLEKVNNNLQDLSKKDNKDIAYKENNNIVTPAITKTQDTPELNPKLPLKTEDEKFSIPETGIYLVRGTYEQKAIIGSATIILILGILIRFLVKAVI